MKSSISIILILFMILTSIGLVSADPGNTTDTGYNSTNIILPIDPTALFMGSLSVKLNPTTLHVNDTVQIIITATNTGLVDWGNLTIYAPVPAGLQFISFEAPGLTMQNYNPTTGIWNVYQMRDFNRGQQKTGIITAKVLPSAVGQTINATAKFNSLNLEIYNINMVSDYPGDVPVAKSSTAIVAEGISGAGPGGSLGGGTGGGGSGIAGSGNNTNSSGIGNNNGNGTSPATNFGNSILTKYVGNLTQSYNSNNPLASLQTIGGGSKSNNKAYEINKIQPQTNSDSLGNTFAIVLVIGMIAAGIYLELRKSQ